MMNYVRTLVLLLVLVFGLIGIQNGQHEISVHAVGSTKNWDMSEYATFRTRLRTYLEKKQASRAPLLYERTAFAVEPVQQAVVTTAPSSWATEVSRANESTKAQSILSSVTFTTPAPAPKSVEPVEALPRAELESFVSSITFEETSASLTDAEKEAWKNFYATVLQKFPQKFLSSLKFMRFRVSEEGSRGLAGSNIMILKIMNMSKPEASTVAIHELGHVVDLGYLTGSGGGDSAFRDGGKVIPQNDPSVAFYSLSFQDEKTLKSTAKNEDFVSGYALSDPFEDFSETFLYYVIHGEHFTLLAEKNTVLAQKYMFMRDVVFEGKEFTGMTKKDISSYTTQRPWDATLEPYNYMAFWGESFR